MAKLILDTLTDRDAIGIAISDAIREDVNNVQIVSPYVSDIMELLSLEETPNLRIICNARSAACNPNTLIDLLALGSVEIRSRTDIHAKVYICKKRAFVASANATRNGLSTGRNTVFTFWHTIDDAPVKSRVGTQARNAGVHELPEDIANWDYWIESEDFTSDTSDHLAEILGHYYNSSLLTLKSTHGLAPTYTSEKPSAPRCWLDPSSIISGGDACCSRFIAKTTYILPSRSIGMLGN